MDFGPHRQSISTGSAFRRTRRWKYCQLPAKGEQFPPDIYSINSSVEPIFVGFILQIAEISDLLRWYTSWELVVKDPR